MIQNMTYVQQQKNHGLDRKHEAKPNKICKRNLHNIKKKNYDNNKQVLWNFKSPKVI
jgi:hypothetical protein